MIDDEIRDCSNTGEEIIPQEMPRKRQKK